MTYDNLIQRIILRGFKFLQGTPFIEKGAIYEALITAYQKLEMDVRDIQASAIFSITSGTSSYTVASIASDIGEINFITLGSPTFNTIEGIMLRQFNDEQQAQYNAYYNQVHEIQTDPKFFKVWNGTITIFPTPSQDYTATVYYTPKISLNFYTSAIGSTSLSIDDNYLNAIMYEALAILAEMVGQDKLSLMYRGQADREKDLARASKVQYQYDSHITFHDGVNS